MADLGERGRIVAIDDQPRDFVGFIRDKWLIEKYFEGKRSEAHPRGHALLFGFGCDAGKHVART